MLQLHLENGFVVDLGGLGSQSPSLKGKTVNPKVRGVLRKEYGGENNVCACCEPDKLDDTHWLGKCCIRQNPQGTRCPKPHCTHKSKTMLSHFEYYIYPDIWRLIFADDPAAVERLEAEIGHKQAEAVDSIIEQSQSCWRGYVQPYVGGEGTADERRKSLRAAWRAKGWPTPVPPTTGQ